MTKIPFELLMVRSLYSIVRALENIDPRQTMTLEPTIKELTAFERDFHQRKDFEDSH